MEDLLVVTNYYPPDKGAASNRIEQLALKLSQHNYRVSVLCPLGNYPEGKLFPEYRGKFSAVEHRQGIRVKRLWIYPSNSKNIAVRLLSIQSFSTVLFFSLLFGKLPKKVVVQSPPLLLSFLSMLALSLRGRKIILNVSDLWPMAALELKVMKHGSLGHKFALALERFIYRRAAVVLGQSGEILAHVRQVAPGKPCFLYRNFPDHREPFAFRTDGTAQIRLFYAGLLGVAQGVLESCKKMVLPAAVEFHIFGDGAEKAQIEDYIRTHPEKNIFFHGMIDRRELHSALEGFDIAYVPLAARIYGSVPSKIFEYGALGMPILYFGGGEGEDIVRSNNLGWVVPVADFDRLNATLADISLMGKPALGQFKTAILETARRHFSLDVQIGELISQDVF